MCIQILKITKIVKIITQLIITKKYECNNDKFTHIQLFIFTMIEDFSKIDKRTYPIFDTRQIRKVLLLLVNIYVQGSLHYRRYMACHSSFVKISKIASHTYPSIHFKITSNVIS